MTDQKFVKLRFAPSPTGALHLGNARTAIITWLASRALGGQFLLRIDDTDQERSKEEYVEGIQRELRWLGLEWEDYARQKDRFNRYQALIEKLKSDGWLYPCYETPEELALKRKSQLGRGQPPIYDRAALSLTETQIRQYEDEGRKPHWRFKLKHEKINWTDRVRGEVEFDGSLLSDPVLIREDGSPLYHLCSVIDDMDFGISHIVRGEDHVTNTAAHLQMFDALGAQRPECAHLPLMADKEGGKLSKREGASSLQALRAEDGLEPMAIVSVLARLGTSDPIEPLHSLEPLIESFDFAKFSRATPKFDPDELLRVNAKLIHDMPYEEVRERLITMGLGHINAALWAVIRANISRLPEAEDWARIVSPDLAPVIDDPDFTSEAADLLPPEPWDAQTWDQWITEIKQKTGRKGKNLFMPLRRALTGMDHGPELHALLPLIGREEAERRLRGQSASATPERLHTASS